MSSALNLPASKGSTVEVSVLNGGRLAISAAYVVHNPVPGHDMLDAPCYSFLIKNKKLGKKVLYDLGFMKAWEDKQPPAREYIKRAVLGQIEVAKAIVEIEKDANVPLESISVIIWSHHHIDHAGDPSLFPKSTSLVVGPGFKSDKTTFPGYPKNPDAITVEDAFVGREVIELDFSTGLSIGGFPSVDYFNDGSFYILQAQGHTHDHICALARTSKDKFTFFGGDAAHYLGEYRPTPHLPLPVEITPSPFHSPVSTSVCASTLFQNIHRAKAAGGDYRITPFYEVSPISNVSPPEAQATVDKMQHFDASLIVFVVIAHDVTLLDILPFYPKDMTGWDVARSKTLGTWRFLQHFEKAVNASETH